MNRTRLQGGIHHIHLRLFHSVPSLLSPQMAQPRAQAAAPGQQQDGGILGKATPVIRSMAIFFAIQTGESRRRNGANGSYEIRNVIRMSTTWPLLMTDGTEW